METSERHPLHEAVAKTPEQVHAEAREIASQSREKLQSFLDRHHQTDRMFCEKTADGLTWNNDPKNFDSRTIFDEAVHGYMQDRANLQATFADLPPETKESVRPSRVVIESLGHPENLVVDLERLSRGVEAQGLLDRSWVEVDQDQATEADYRIWGQNWAEAQYPKQLAGSIRRLVMHGNRIETEAGKGQQSRLIAETLDNLYLQARDNGDARFQEAITEFVADDKIFLPGVKDKLPNVDKLQFTTIKERSAESNHRLAA